MINLIKCGLNYEFPTVSWDLKCECFWVLGSSLGNALKSCCLHWKEHYRIPYQFATTENTPQQLLLTKGQALWERCGLSWRWRELNFLLSISLFTALLIHWTKSSRLGRETGHGKVTKWHLADRCLGCQGHGINGSTHLTYLSKGKGQIQYRQVHLLEQSYKHVQKTLDLQSWPHNYSWGSMWIGLWIAMVEVQENRRGVREADKLSSFQTTSKQWIHSPSTLCGCRDNLLFFTEAPARG